MLHEQNFVLFNQYVVFYYEYIKIHLPILLLKGLLVASNFFILLTKLL